MQDGAEVVGGGEAGKIAVEGQGLDAVDAEAAQQRLLLLRRVQQAEGAGVLLQDGARMLRKSNDNRLLAPFAGGGDECLYHLAVAQMDPVEILFTSQDASGALHVQEVEELQMTNYENGVATYETEVLPEHTGMYQVAKRVYPKNPLLAHRQDFPLVKWL